MNDKNNNDAALASSCDTSQSLLTRFWYEIGVHVSTLTFTLGFSLRVKGQRNVPQSGPLLVVSNHQSFLDPVAVGVSVRRHLVFLARKTLFRNPFFSWLIRSYNAVPIDQEGVGKEGIKTIVQQLRQQKAVLVFPEGERTPNGQMLPLRPGVHLLIRRAESLILPVGVAGAYEAYSRWMPLPVPAPLFMPPRPGTLAVCIGKPIPSNSLANLPREQALQRLTEEIQNMQQQAEALRRK